MGKDYYGRLCNIGSFCGGTIATIYWYYVNGGSTWGYGSIEGGSKYITSTGYYCATECLYDTSNKYFQCRKYDGHWDYCSPTKDIDAHGRVCDNSKCSKAIGATNYQCFYGISQWDACGVEPLNEKCPHCSASTTATVQQAQQCVRSV